MNEFDYKASGWDLNPMHIERSEAVARQIIERIPVNKSMSALEFGAGTGITSLLLKDHLKEITMMDNSSEMVKIMNKKMALSGLKHLNVVHFDLEKNGWTGQKFELIITQMVLHHVADINDIINKFYKMLNPGGYIAIADLYPEDGSFHGESFTGHKGFDPELLSDQISKQGFTNTSSRKCYEIKKQIFENKIRQFDLFLLIAVKK